MAKCFFLLFLLLCIWCNNVFTQTGCTSSFYQTSFHHGGSTFSTSINVLASGNTIVSNFANADFNLIKITTSGDTIWNKTYTTDGIYYQGAQQITRIDKDGTLMCSLQGNRLLKVDTNGIVLWAKHIEFQEIEQVYDLQVLDNGDKIMLCEASEWGRALLVRLNSDCNTVKWCKYIQFYTGSFSNLVNDNDKIVFGGSASENDYTFNRYPFICSIDLATGKLPQFKFYKFENAEGVIRSLYKCGDGYIGNASIYYSPNGHHAYVRVSSDLSLRLVQHYDGVDPSVQDDYTFNFAPQSDGSFYLAYGGYWDLTLSYISNKDKVVWVKDMPGFYSYPTDMKQSADGLYIVGFDNYHAMATNTYETNLYVTKCDYTGSPGECQPENSPSV